MYAYMCVCVYVCMDKIKGELRLMRMSRGEDTWVYMCMYVCMLCVYVCMDKIKRELIIVFMHAYIHAGFQAYKILSSNNTYRYVHIYLHT